MIYQTGEKRLKKIEYDKTVVKQKTNLTKGKSNNISSLVTLTRIYVSSSCSYLFILYITLPALILPSNVPITRVAPSPLLV